MRLGNEKLRVLACAVFDSEVLLTFFFSSLPMGGNLMARQRGLFAHRGKWVSAAFSVLYLLLPLPDPVENNSALKLV